MPRFSEKTVECLREAGWFPGRKIGIEHIEKALTTKGFVIFPAAQKFFREFDGLEYVYPYSKRFGRGVIFDAEELSLVDYEKYAKYIAIVGSALCPIGQQDFEILLIDPEGRIYGAEAGKVIQICNSPDEFIDNLTKGDQANFLLKEIK